MLRHLLGRRFLSSTPAAATAAASSSAIPTNLPSAVSQLYASAKQGEKVPELLQSVSLAAKENSQALKALSPALTAQLAWSFAFLNHRDDDLMTLLASNSTSTTTSDARSLVQLSFAFAAQDLLYLPQVRRFFKSAPRNVDKVVEKESYLPLLYTCAAWTQDVEKAVLPPLLTSLTQGDLSDQVPQLVSNQLTTTQEIAFLFRELVLDHNVQENVLVPEIEVSIDVVWPKRRVALEVVFAKEDLLQNGEANGLQQLKNRVLRKAGWEVHVINGTAFEEKFGMSRDLSTKQVKEAKKEWLAHHWWPPRK